MKRITILMVGLILGIVLITEYTDNPLLAPKDSCPVTIRTRIALRGFPNQDPTKYTTVSDIPWGYTNNMGARVVDIMGAHRVGPINLPTDDAYGRYKRPSAYKKTSISFTLSTDVAQYGYNLEGVRYRSCNATGEICGKYSDVKSIVKSPQKADLTCNKTLEYDWVVTRSSSKERIYCPIQVEALVYQMSTQGVKELISVSSMGKDPWGVRNGNNQILPFNSNLVAQRRTQTKYAYELSKVSFYHVGKANSFNLQGPNFDTQWEIANGFCEDNPIASRKSCVDTSKKNEINLTLDCGSMVQYGWTLKQKIQQ